MFHSQRYMTKRVSLELAVDLQILLWDLIDGLRAKEGFQVDYLQVFDLKAVRTKDGETVQQVIHTQERPTYKMIYSFAIEKPIDGKLFAIDEGDYSTILFADEY